MAKTGPKKKTATHRFTNRIEKIRLNTGKNDCWLWNPNGDPEQYATFRTDTSTVGAHVHSFTYHTNLVVPEGFVVMHLCSQKQCVNPSHLTIGTQAANLAHMVLQGRSSAYADRKPRSPMTQGEKLLAVMKYLSGENFNQIARELNRGRQHVKSVVENYLKKSKTQLISTLEHALVELDANEVD